MVLLPLLVGLVSFWFIFICRRWKVQNDWTNLTYLTSHLSTKTPAIDEHTQEKIDILFVCDPSLFLVGPPPATGWSGILLASVDHLKTRLAELALPILLTTYQLKPRPLMNTPRRKLTYYSSVIPLCFSVALLPLPKRKGGVGRGTEVYYKICPSLSHLSNKSNSAYFPFHSWNVVRMLKQLFLHNSYLHWRRIFCKLF